jgi:hypothetical protein
MRIKKEAKKNYDFIRGFGPGTPGGRRVAAGLRPLFAGQEAQG